MSRIKTCFAACKKDGRTALIPFITAGDPNRSVTLKLMHAMVKAGADIIELGVPFSDPMADGPTIQRSSERALKYGTSLRDVLEIVAEFRSQDNTTPVVLMGYLNPIESMGYRYFVESAEIAGVDGVLTVDLPPEEGAEFEQLCEQHNIDPIYLIAPTTTEKRIEKISRSARGFTGGEVPDFSEVSKNVDMIRSKSPLPVGVGFGIKDAQSAATVGEFADAVVIGSVLVNKMEELQDNPEQIPDVISGIISNIHSSL